MVQLHESFWSRGLSGENVGRSRLGRTPPLAPLAAKAAIAGTVIGWLAFSAVAAVDVELIARMIEFAAGRLEMLLGFLPFGG